jgi:hypothetical protein
MRGMAADVRLPGRSLADLQQAALSLELGGVGYYPKSNFIHVDVGRRLSLGNLHSDGRGTIALFGAVSLMPTSRLLIRKFLIY